MPTFVTVGWNIQIFLELVKRNFSGEGVISNVFSAFLENRDQNLHTDKEEMVILKAEEIRSLLNEAATHKDKVLSWRLS